MNDDALLPDVLSRLGGSDADADNVPRSAAARTLDSLRRRIISLQLPPDTVLSRTELAREYDVSQTPVRDALQVLESEGLVDIQPQSRTVVTRIDPDRIAEAHFLRRAIEVEVVRELAATITPAQLDRLKMIVSLQETVIGQDRQTGTFQGLDETFHQTMIAAAGHPGLHTIIRSHSGHLDRLRRLDMWDTDKLSRIVKEHKEIVAMLEAGDADGAIGALRTHLGQTIKRIEALRDKHPDFFKT
ncbi:DNA-binding GntR family transcriptional regulator [Rhodovulum iodosum]|uniref:DNA-binding GntR family transcriptional regulator n=1 Tax=Rhodovulum iodosum TaxID=68291 RepID=A0ABV3XWP3_9RHOB|nr:GntR family transcriptional regulator [Rhodovulum robiginosum]RSK32207.1 GntR family transcriptional regulator [Rhodovulum robiginosum]